MTIKTYGVDLYIPINQLIFFLTSVKLFFKKFKIQHLKNMFNYSFMHKRFVGLKSITNIYFYHKYKVFMVCLSF